MKVNTNNSIYALSGDKPERSGEALTPDELNDLIILVKQLTGTAPDDTTLEASIRGHIGPESIYALKEPVLQSLKIVYERLKDEGIKAPEKQMIAMKLQERAAHCTPGFHNGVNGIVDGFYSAKNVVELMQRVRQSVVSSMANGLTDEVHANNRCFVVAAGLARQGDFNYGVRALNRGDIYRGGLSDEIIRGAL